MSDKKMSVLEAEEYLRDIHFRNERRDKAVDIVTNIGALVSAMKGEIAVPDYDHKKFIEAMKIISIHDPELIHKPFRQSLKEAWQEIKGDK